MDQYVIKRNGQYAPFIPFKIEDALKRGFQSVQKEYDSGVFNAVIQKLETKTTWAVPK